MSNPAPSRVLHVTLAIVGLFSVFLPELARMLTDLQLPVWAAYVTKAAGAIALLKADLPLVLSLLKPGLATAVILTLAACLPAIPVVPLTPANQAQISGCTGISNWANGLTVGGMVIGVGSGTLGTVAAALPAGAAKTDLGYTSAGVAFAVAAAETVAGLEHAAFASDRCADVLGPLPDATSAPPPPSPSPSLPIPLLPVDAGSPVFLEAGGQ